LQHLKVKVKVKVKSFEEVVLAQVSRIATSNCTFSIFDGPGKASNPRPAADVFITARQLEFQSPCQVDDSCQNIGAGIRPIGAKGDERGVGRWRAQIAAYRLLALV
jgi:hypothetical protein